MCCPVSLIDADLFCVPIPPSPQWDENTSAEVLQQAERDTFLEWRRELAQYVFSMFLFYFFCNAMFIDFSTSTKSTSSQ